MRLIDADKLIYQSHAQHIQPYINKKDIDNAPTVEMAEDCISREEAKKLIQGKIDDIPKNKDGTYGSMFGQYVNGLYCAKTVISYMPSVQPQPKRGKWIRITNGAMREKYKCSECGRQIEEDGIEGLIAIKYPYCHCGCRMDADMREVQNND